MLEELTRLYSTTPTKELAELFGVSVCSIYTKAKSLGLKKDMAVIEQRKREHLTAMNKVLKHRNPPKVSIEEYIRNETEEQREMRKKKIKDAMNSAEGKRKLHIRSIKCKTKI